MPDHIRAFQDCIEAAGLRPDHILADGILHRCPVEGGKRGARDGVYKFHPDQPPSGYYCNHKSGESGTWTASSREKMTQADRDRLRQRIEKDRAEAAAKLARERQATARAAQAMLARANDCSKHPYLSAKGVNPAPGLKVLGDVLLVPRLNLKGEVISLVRIWPDGTKKNLPGATYRGGFFVIKGKDGPLLICEGISTGLSLHQATGLTVLCTFDCGNLQAVAQGARGAYPDREIIICGDQDGPGNGNPGVRHATQAAQAVSARLAIPSLLDQDKVDFNDIHISLGLGAVKDQVEQAQPLVAAEQQGHADTDQWMSAQRIFPRIPFPWEVLLKQIADSIKQLARSCAGSASPLPGVVLSVIAAAVGNLVSVSPKKSWKEPLVFYVVDIRESGEGKTAPLWELARPLTVAQEKENLRAEQEMLAFEALEKKDQKKAKKPAPARGYFATGCTVEGLREDLANNDTGGILIIQSELSSFITGQNQYKRSGDDREVWLSLWDGRPARVVRAGGRTAYIRGGRPSVGGGIQPEVFKKAFTSLDGIYIYDGTVFRFLPTYEPPAHYELTSESWEDHHRQPWHDTVERALAWADRRVMQNFESSIDPDGNNQGQFLILLDLEAQERFLDWRNDLSSKKHELPPSVRGYVPKLVSYALRLAGVVHLLRAFATGEQPKPFLNLAGINDGIRLAMFYAGQAVDALSLLQGKDDQNVQEVSERTLCLARVLEALKPEVDSGRLAYGLIQERYNLRTAKTDQFRTAKSMGAFLRSLGLTVSSKPVNANGKRGVYCLIWDKKIDEFISRVSMTPDEHEMQQPDKEAAECSDMPDEEEF